MSSNTASGVVPLEGKPEAPPAIDGEAAAADVSDEILRQVSQDLDEVRAELSKMMQEDFQHFKGPTGNFRRPPALDELEREQKAAELRSREHGLMAKLREQFDLVHAGP